MPHKQFHEYLYKVWNDTDDSIYKSVTGFVDHCINNKREDRADLRVILPRLIKLII